MEEIYVDTFFEHENHSYPPSISEYGVIRSGTKCDLLPCLSDNISLSMDHMTIPDSSAIIIDVSVMVHMITPDKTDTFQSYAERFYEHIIR